MLLQALHAYVHTHTRAYVHIHTASCFWSVLWAGAPALREGEEAALPEPTLLEPVASP